MSGKGKQFQKIMHEEITRLRTPPVWKENEYGNMKPYDYEGNKITTYIGEIPTVEPKTGILSDNEVLRFAPFSKSASFIRVKKGIGCYNDSKAIIDPGMLLFTGMGWYLTPMVLLYVIFNSMELVIVITIFILVGLLYFYFFYPSRNKNKNNIKNNNNYKNNNPKEQHNKEPTILNDDDLVSLFKSKEKIAREMIELKFPAPQLTNTKFSTVLDNCVEVVESQIKILNRVIVTSETEYELYSRRELIKKVIGKIDDLNNELILSEGGSLEEIISEIDELIEAVPKYNNMN